MCICYHSARNCTMTSSNHTLHFSPAFRRLEFNLVRHLRLLICFSALPYDKSQNTSPRLPFVITSTYMNLRHIKSSSAKRIRAPTNIFGAHFTFQTQLVPSPLIWKRVEVYRVLLDHMREFIWAFGRLSSQHLVHPVPRPRLEPHTRLNSWSQNCASPDVHFLSQDKEKELINYM
jgi:hypothetical protein